MIITRLIGGLGNQLFQYAVARKLAIENNTSVKLDLTPYQTDYTLWEYELDHFSINAQIATVGDLLSMAGGFALINERGLEFNPRFLEVRGNIFLSGYFGSPRYFEDIREPLLQEIEIKDPPTGHNAVLLDMIRQDNAVCVHVRRGDYLTINEASHQSRNCTFEYYQKGIEKIAEKCGEDITLYVFTNDPYWVQRNWKFDYRSVYISHNPENQGQEDFRLMKACRHFVIANSSFSWWAAWLGAHSDKIVCAPARWVSPDILPSNWLTVENRPS